MKFVIAGVAAAVFSSGFYIFQTSDRDLVCSYPEAEEIKELRVAAAGGGDRVGTLELHPIGGGEVQGATFKYSCTGQRGDAVSCKRSLSEHRFEMIRVPAYRSEAAHFLIDKQDRSKNKVSIENVVCDD